MRLALRDEIRSLEKELMRDGGFPSVALMETAGRGLAADIIATFGATHRAARIVCGRGNNGGDGFVVARYLREAGWAVRVHVIGLGDELTPEATVNARLYRWCGGRFDEFPDGAIPPSLHGEVQIDAILGTGLDRPLAGPYAEAVEHLNEAAATHCPVYAVDIPTGLDADTGGVLGTAVKAGATGTLGLGKPGLYVTPGIDYAGRVHVIDIGIPERSSARWARTAAFLDDGEPILALTPRPFASHKGHFGHVLVFAGGPGKVGAADLACRGAVRGGAGLVTLSAPVGTQASWPEVMHEPLDGWSAQAWNEGLLQRKQAVVFGPGIGTSDGARDFLEQVAKTDRPLVLDADGLNLLARNQHLLAGRQAPTVLTPHPAEAARLLGSDTEIVQANRPAAAVNLARQYGAVTVLKGARSLIAMPDGRYWINGSGSPALAAGGMGDVLSGIVAALLARGKSVEKAACMAVFAHGRAGERLEGRAGGVRASEVADALPPELEKLLGAPPLPDEQ